MADGAQDLPGLLVSAFLGREPDEAEHVAIAGQVARAAAQILPPRADGENPLFDVDPALWQALMAQGRAS